MKADDLRIGNWVKDIKKGYVSIHGIEPNWDEVWLNYCHGSGIYKKRIIEIEPIPLTEELLKKCGFDLVVKEGNQGEFRVYQLNEITYNTNHGWWWKHHLTVQPKYIHELQNLFFALTGEELEINLEEK